MAEAIEHAYSYAHASRLETRGERTALRLATSGGAAEHPHFFEGRLLHPATTAVALRALARVVSERFYLPPGMLQRILRERDPVITSGGGRLRFEAMSACCSAHARVDLLPDACDGDLRASGTTNVDFGDEMRAALSRITSETRVDLAVGREGMSLTRDDDEVVERRVQLPVRWLKSFVEVQAFQSRMERRLRLDRLEALRFLRSVPRSRQTGLTVHAIPHGAGLRLSSTRADDGIAITGFERLRVLEPMLATCDHVDVLATADGQSTEWVVVSGPVRFSLAMTAEVSRGFSGEGQVLAALAGEVDAATLAAVRAQLRWQAALDAGAIAREVGRPPTEVHSALAVLGSRGLVGFDASEGAYFHRELPFAMESVARMHPRLVEARRLAAGSDVEIVRRTASAIEAIVPGRGVDHHVTLEGSSWRCTCTWHAKHGMRRGACKHVLAARLAAEGEGS